MLHTLPIYVYKYYMKTYTHVLALLVTIILTAVHCIAVIVIFEITAVTDTLTPVSVKI